MAGEKPDPVRTHLRNMIIVPEMIGSIIGVYNGKTFNQVRPNFPAARSGSHALPCFHYRQHSCLPSCGCATVLLLACGFDYHFAQCQTNC